MDIKPLTKEQREKIEAENKRIAEANAEHNKIFQEERVFEWMDKRQDEGFKWGEPRTYQDN